MMEKIKKELIDAGEMKPEEKLTLREMTNRYTTYNIKKSQSEMQGLGQKAAAPSAEKAVAPKPSAPVESIAAAPLKKETPLVKKPTPYQSSVDQLLVARDRSNQILKQNQTLVLELLGSQDPVLAQEFLKLQTWLEKSAQSGMDQKALMDEASKKVDTVQKLFKKKLAGSLDLQKGSDLLLPKLQKNNAAMQSYHEEMERQTKEMASVLEKAGGGAK